VPEQDLIREAEERGEAQAKLGAQVAGHERHLKAINGSIERHAQATEALQRRVADVATRMATAEKLEEWKREQEEKSRSWKQVAFAAMAGGVFVVFAALISALVVIFS
jgi:chromosome segregation ATPase